MSITKDSAFPARFLTVHHRFSPVSHSVFLSIGVPIRANNAIHR
jgi:hypothetical protein